MPGLGRIYQPDPRDREFLMERALPEVAPVGRKLWDVPHLYDQGATPRCVGYSISGGMTALEAPKTVVWDADALYVWANANDGSSGPHDGTSVRAGFQGVITQGETALVSNDSDDPVSSVTKLQSYLWADTSKPDGDIDRIITWLLTIGPVIIGIDWYNNMFTPDGSGYVHIGGGVAGGHAIMLRGVDATIPSHTFFVLHNSWGAWGCTITDHGDALWIDSQVPGGDALISRADLLTLLQSNGEAGALVDNINQPTPAPKPTPLPTPSPLPTPPPPPPNPGLWSQVQAILDRAMAEIKHLLGVT